MNTFLELKTVTDSQMLSVCLDIAWWLTELHGNNNGSNWKIFFSALDPSKIGIFKMKGTYFAFIKDYRMAQGNITSLYITH